MGLLKLFKKKKKIPALWRNDAQFQDLYAKSKGTTLVTADRCFMIYQWAKRANGIIGDAAEVGVYKGGTARIIASVMPQKQFHLFDTFSGMPDVNKSLDYHREGEFHDTSLASVKSFLEGFKNVIFYPGFFPKTAHSITRHTFSFVHIDVDIYQSIKDSLDFFYPRMTQGGVMIFDDYDWKDCPGVKLAVDEFCIQHNITPVISALYQCLIIK